MCFSVRVCVMGTLVSCHSSGVKSLSSGSQECCTIIPCCPGGYCRASWAQRGGRLRPAAALPHVTQRLRNTTLIRSATTKTHTWQSSWRLLTGVCDSGGSPLASQKLQPIEVWICWTKVIRVHAQIFLFLFTFLPLCSLSEYIGSFRHCLFKAKCLYSLYALLYRWEN